MTDKQMNIATYVFVIFAHLPFDMRVTKRGPAKLTPLGKNGLVGVTISVSRAGLM
jgi:hypothetical protein